MTLLESEDSRKKNKFLDGMRIAPSKIFTKFLKTKRYFRSAELSHKHKALCVG